jgi:amino acid transporter
VVHRAPCRSQRSSSRSASSTSAASESAFVVNTLTIGKLPLVIFIVLGCRTSTGAAAAVTSLTFAQIASAALYLTFAFGGYEVVPVPAGEAKTLAARCRSR